MLDTNPSRRPPSTVHPVPPVYTGAWASIQSGLQSSNGSLLLNKHPRQDYSIYKVQEHVKESSFCAGSIIVTSSKGETYRRLNI